MMRYFLLLGLIFFSALPGTAQSPCAPTRTGRAYATRTVWNDPNHDDPRIRFGFSVGFNVMDATVKSSGPSVYGLVEKLSPGFNIQGLINVRLNSFLDVRLQPGILFGNRDLVFYAVQDASGQFPGYTFPGWEAGSGDMWVYRNDRHKMQAHYVEMPVLLKIKTMRVSNVRPYVVGGMAPRYNLRKSYSDQDQIFIDSKPFELFYEGGAGLDLYFSFFKLSVELRGSWGMGNVLKASSDAPGDPVFHQSIGRLKHSAYMLSFYFE